MGLTANLLNLFRVDAQVRGLQSRLDSAQRYLDGQTAHLRTLNEQLEELQTRKRHVQANIANLETETATIDDRLEKLRDELNTSVTNKQYTAVLTELNTVKAQRSEIEDRELQQMEAVEQLDAAIAETEGQIGERTKVRDVARAQLEERHAEVGQRLSELEIERASAAGAVPESELAVFEQVSDTYDGEAMAPIEEVDRRHREYACGACNMHLPFEQVVSLMSHGDTLVRCTACDRILYLEEETRGALAPK
ncbi:MAG: zinc ribbon domain-containing protein [Planctomycetota bacterium]|jgi:predicted  nucleic acid-binding Zn-ribbon protein